MELLEKEAIEDLFRFAVLLTGRRAEALPVVAEALGHAAQRAAQFRAQNARWIWTARWIWEQVRRRQNFLRYGEEVDQRLALFFEPLPWRERAALALRSISHLEIAEIAQILNRRPGEVRKLLSDMFEVRQSLKMDECFLRDGVAELKPNAEERLALSPVAVAGVASQGGRKAERLVAVISVVFGVLFIAGFVAFDRWHAQNASPFHEQVSRLMDFTESSVNANERQPDFERLDAKDGEIQDWLYLKRMEGVKLPEPLKKMSFVAGRVAPWRGLEIAQLISEKPRAVLMVSDAAGFQVAGAPIVASQMSASGWTVRWSVSGRYLFLFAVKGDSASMEGTLAELERLQ